MAKETINRSDVIQILLNEKSEWSDLASLMSRKIGNKDCYECELAIEIIDEIMEKVRKLG